MAFAAQGRASVEAMAEREACVDFIRDKMAEVHNLKKRGRIPANEAAQLTRRLDAIADGIGAGLHR
jgi:argininosuccinate lyase